MPVPPYGAPVASGRIRCAPEDFEVDEELGFEPGGGGEHLWLRVEKRGLDTPELGEEVIVLGQRGDDAITLEEIGSWQGTRAHEVLMAFDQRLPGRFLPAGDAPREAAAIR